MNKFRLFAVAAAVLTAAGCGSTVSYGPASARPGQGAAPVAEPGTATFICSAASYAYLLEWTDNNGNLSGTYDSSAVSGQAPQEHVSSSSGDWSGTLNGNTFSLAEGFAGYGQRLYGTLNGSQLTVNVPQSDGSLQALTCRSGTVADWNRIVAAFDSQTSSANNAANQAARQQRQQDAQAAAVQDAANKKADATAETACAQFGGSWLLPYDQSYTGPNGNTFTITGDPSTAGCHVPYLGTDDATYYVTVTFTSMGTPQNASSGSGTATQSECQNGYYPDQPSGQTSQPPGKWSTALGLCLP